MITQERLKYLFNYDPNVGLFIRKVMVSTRMIGEVAGYIEKDGYRRITVDNDTYTAHRLAWLYVYGVMPDKLLDHINSNRSDNRISNLREADYCENAHHSKVKSTNRLGIKGVYKYRNRYRVRPMVRGKRYSLGSFTTKEEAKEVYNKFTKDNHKEFFIEN